MNFANVTDWTIPQGDVIRVIDSQSRIIWEKNVDPEYSTPFYFENTTDTSHNVSIKLKNPDDVYRSFIIKYSYDCIDWTSVIVGGPYGSSDLFKSISNVPAHTKLYLKTTDEWWPVGTNVQCYAEFSIANPSLQTNTQWFKIGGNFMSLVNGTTSQYFNGASNYMDSIFATGGIYSAEKLGMPLDTVPNCYKNLFSWCYDLIIPPKLPATVLSEGCYYNMFGQAANAYPWRLQRAPELPATTLVKDCYREMFVSQNNISSIKCLATSGINTNNSTTSWVSNVAASGTFTKVAGATWPTGTSGIPSGWTVVDAQ